MLRMAVQCPTSTILLAEIGKPPDVAEPDTEAEDGEEELDRAVPRGSLPLLHHHRHLLLSSHDDLLLVVPVPVVPVSVVPALLVPVPPRSDDRLNTSMCTIDSLASTELSKIQKATILPSTFYLSNVW